MFEIYELVYIFYRQLHTLSFMSFLELMFLKNETGLHQCEAQDLDLSSVKLIDFLSLIKSEF